MWLTLGYLGLAGREDLRSNRSLLSESSHSRQLSVLDGAVLRGGR